jgi:tetratricopeptide (TPR) repeat protein
MAEHAFGILTNIPLVWLALAVPLGWRGRSAEKRFRLCEFLVAVALLFCIGSLTLVLFFYAAGRYEVEFLPALVLLAVIGILSMERAVAPTSESGQAARPVWRRVMRWGWGLLLAFSVAFNLFASVERCLAAHIGLGLALVRVGKVQEAIGHYEQALRFDPDSLKAHYNLGNALLRVGRVQEAIGHYEQAVRLEPDYADAHNNLGAALVRQGRLQEAIGHYEQAVSLAPDFAEAQYNLGNALEHAGQVQKAIGHYEQALRLKPDFVQARNALARLRGVE